MGNLSAELQAPVMTQTVLQHIIKHKSVLLKKTVGIAIRVYDIGRRQYDESASHFFLLKFIKILANR